MAESPTVAGSGTRTPALGAFTVTVASPAVFSFTSHGLNAGDIVTINSVSSGGALPTGLALNTAYYVISSGLSTNAFEVSTTLSGSALNTSGSQSGTFALYSECFLYSTSGPGTFTFDVDANPLATGDVLELRVYKMVLSGGTSRVCYLTRYFDAQPVDDQIKVSVPVSTPLSSSGALEFTIKQTNGTGRAVPWSVNQY